MKKGRRDSVTRPNFLYRIEVCDNIGECQCCLAEVTADTDEDARRKIIHKTMALGGQARVKSITPTDDSTCYPGEARKQVYTGPDVYSPPSADQAM